MGNKIFGRDWDDIQRAQSKTGKLNKAIDTCLPSKKPPTDSDRELLKQYGSVQALKDAGLFGVADRLEE